MATKYVRSITSVNDLNLNYITDICDRAICVYREIREGNPNTFKNYLAGDRCNLLFFQSSTRTYNSFEDAFSLLGAESVGGFRSSEESSISKGESIYHTIETFVGQGTGPKFIIIRDGFEGTALWARISAFKAFSKKIREYAKEYASFPRNFIFPIIFNGGDGKHAHPSQLLLDCASMRHKIGRITDINFGECNDIGGSRVVSSHIDAAHILNWHMHLCPFPDSSLSTRQRYSLLKSKAAFSFYENVSDMLPLINLLYVNRYQFNLRGEKTGPHAGNMFSVSHPKISLNLINPFNIPVFHARPIDKNAQEISPDLYDHHLDYSGIQSDFGVPARMAMCMYAIDNRLFSFEGLINSLNLKRLGFHREDLTGSQAKNIKDELYTTARIRNGFVIDHIPRGCGSVIASLISKLAPEIPIVLSMNVKGAYSNSMPKDVLKLHVTEDFLWTEVFNSIVVLFTDYSAKKSCRVSKFMNGVRVEKWAFRMRISGNDTCCNDKCITRPERLENIFIKHKTEEVFGIKMKVCPFCETPQNMDTLADMEAIAQNNPRL